MLTLGLADPVQGRVVRPDIVGATLLLLEEGASTFA